MRRILGGLTFLLGLGLTLLGVTEFLVYQEGSAVPDQITLKELGVSEPSKNVNLIITDFQFGDRYKIEENKKAKWKQVWIPLWDLNGNFTKVPVIAHIKGPTRREEIDALSLRKEIPGILTRGIDSIGNKERRYFKSIYPETDFKNAISFEIDRRFPSLLFIIPTTLAGITLIVLGLGFAWGYFLQRLP